LGNLIDAASSILMSTERKTDRISNNIANISTPGFKRNIAISHVDVETNRAESLRPFQNFIEDSTSGTLKQTGNAFDIAIVGGGHFLVRQADQFFLTRSGQFSRGVDGTLRDANGMVLQLAAGGDATVQGEKIDILGDGTMLDGGIPVGAIGIFATPEGTNIRSSGGLVPVAGEADAVDDTEFEIRQGMLESSNVVLSDEMVALMANVRQAEGAAQLVRAYDQLIGQAITTFARAGR
jgi:flagellar basal body rod protein FlgG